MFRLHFIVLLTILIGFSGISVAQTDLNRALAAINEETLIPHIQFLSNDLLLGRAVGSAGSKIAQLYISSQMKLYGLKPGFHDTSYFQEFNLIEVNTNPDVTLVIKGKDGQLSFKYYDEFMGFPGIHEESVGIKDAQLMFVGYGIQAPEFKWDDFKDVDVKGKVLLIMNNDPDTGDPEFFGGKARLYYGRWDYKYEQAARMGAVGAIIIHTTPSAGYPWKVVQTSWSGAQAELPQTGVSPLKYKGWITEEVAYKIAKLAGKDLDKLRESAEDKKFKPQRMGVTVSGQMQSTFKKIKATNVLGVLPGSDPELKNEAIVFTAHYDHLGVGKKVDGDSIYNGALDNASGVSAILNLAMAFKLLDKSPRRSIVFIAVDGEESGLLGSQNYARYPTFPPGRIAANINIDGVNIWGKTKDISLIGGGKSTIDKVINQIAKKQGRVALPDPMPEQGYFYRADQFSFAKIGVPCIYINEGQDFIGKPESWGKKTVDHWIDTYYHQPSDEYSNDWNLSGAIEDLQLIFQATLEIANNVQMPSWVPGDEFEAVRLKALEEVEK